MNQRDSDPVGIPGTSDAVDADGLLRGVEEDLRTLDQLDGSGQVPVYDRMHTTLADALARTADTGSPPVQGRPGA